MKYLLTFVLTIGMNFIFAQQYKIDSLHSLLSKISPDTNKVIQSYNLCDEYVRIGLYDTALHYGNAALELARQLRFKKGISSAYASLGIIYYHQAHYSKTLSPLRKEFLTRIARIIFFKNN